MTGYADWQNLNNGWRQYTDDYNTGSTNPINGLYSYKIDDYTKFSIYIDVTARDTLCVFYIESVYEDGSPKIYYTYGSKSTYFFDVFDAKSSHMIDMVKFEYDEEGDFSTGFNVRGLGQNKTATKLAMCLLKGKSLKFVVYPPLEEFQEIKEFVLPSIKGN